MLQLVYIHAELNSLLIKINGQVLNTIFKKSNKPFIKLNLIQQLQGNAEQTMIVWSGQQNNNNYKYFHIILHCLKNINYPCIYTTEIQEMIFIILQKKIETDLQQELYILLQELNSNQIKLYNWIYMLGLMDVV